MDKKEDKKVYCSECNFYNYGCGKTYEERRILEHEGNSIVRPFKEDIIYFFNYICEKQNINNNCELFEKREEKQKQEEDNSVLSLTEKIIQLQKRFYELFFKTKTY